MNNQTGFCHQSKKPCFIPEFSLACLDSNLVWSSGLLASEVFILESTAGPMKHNSSTEGHFTHEIDSPWPLHFKNSHWWKRQSQSKFASHYAWGTDGVRECTIDVTSIRIPTWHPMDHVFTVTWIIFKNHLLKVDLTQNHKTMALRMLTIVHWWYFIMCENPHG